MNVKLIGSPDADRASLPRKENSRLSAAVPVKNTIRYSLPRIPKIFNYRKPIANLYKNIYFKYSYRNNGNEFNMATLSETDTYFFF